MVETTPMPVYVFFVVNVVPNLLVLGSGWILYRFAGAFCRRRLRLPGHPIWFLAFWRLSYVWLTAHSDSYGIQMVLTDLMFFLRILLALVIFFEVRWDTLLFLAVMHSFLVEISNPIFKLGVFDFQFMNFTLSFLQRLGLSDHQKMFWFALLSSLGFVLYDLLSLLPTYLGMVLIRRGVSDKEYRLNGRELLFLLIPAITAIVAVDVTTLFSRLTRTVDASGVSSVDDGNPALVTLEIFLSLFLSVIAIADVYVFYAMLALHKDREEKLVLKQQAEDMKRSLEDQERQNEQIRQMRHDMKNHISVIAQMLSGGNAAPEAVSYLGRLQTELEQNEPKFATGNVTVDALLGVKSQMAARRLPGCDFDAEDLLLPPSLEIEDYDLAVLLGNALDNAIEACERLVGEAQAEHLWIHLSSVIRGDTILIEIENTCPGSLEALGSAKRGAFPRTEKADAGEHGMGFRNMQSVAARYHGMLRWEAKEGVFRLSILLLNEPEKSGAHEA